MNSSDNKKVSVAIATYNGEKYLREQLESLYSQTRVPDEIVVVDDRSIDRTKDILEEYHQKKGLRFIINEQNLGVNQNFEKAIRCCTGDYIAICDQDDVWMPHKIETSLRKLMAIENGKPACVSSQCIGVDKELNVINEDVLIKKDSCGFKATALQKGVCQGCSLMFNRALMEVLIFYPNKCFMYDYYIGFVAAAVGVKYNISEPLMWYRHHDNNVVAKMTNSKPIMNRVLDHLKMWKYSTIFPYTRFDLIQFVLEQYHDKIPQYNREVMCKLLSFKDDDVFSRIKYLIFEDYFSCRDRFMLISHLLASFWLPIEKGLKSDV